MKDQLPPINTGLATRGNDDVPSRAEVAQGQGQVEWVIVAPGDAWPRARATSGELGSFISPSDPERQEITLSGKQLLVAAGSVFCSIFLLVWALTKVWLPGR